MSAGDTIAVRAIGLRKAYGDVVGVDGIDLEVRRGEIFGLIGANGSGKTTTVECPQGLRLPDAGSIDMLGNDPVRDRSGLRTRVGCQLQDSALPDRIKVWEALDLFATLVPDAADWNRLIRDWGLEASAPGHSPAGPPSAQPVLVTNRPLPSRRLVTRTGRARC